MYKQITAGNLYDLRKKVLGCINCRVFIKPVVDMQIEKMMVEEPLEYNAMVAELDARNITLVLERKDGKLRKVILSKIPIPEKKDGE